MEFFGLPQYNAFWGYAGELQTPFGYSPEYNRDSDKDRSKSERRGTGGLPPPPPEFCVFVNFWRKNRWGGIKETPKTCNRHGAGAICRENTDLNSGMSKEPSAAKTHDKHSIRCPNIFCVLGTDSKQVTLNQCCFNDGSAS